MNLLKSASSESMKASVVFFSAVSLLTNPPIFLGTFPSTISLASYVTRQLQFETKTLTAFVA